MFTIVCDPQSHPHTQPPLLHPTLLPLPSLSKPANFQLLPLKDGHARHPPAPQLLLLLHAPLLPVPCLHNKRSHFPTHTFSCSHWKMGTLTTLQPRSSRQRHLATVRPNGTYGLEAEKWVPPSTYMGGKSVGKVWGGVSQSVGRCKPKWAHNDTGLGGREVGAPVNLHGWEKV